MFGLILDTECWIRNYRGAVRHDVQGQEGDTLLDLLFQIVERDDVRIVLPDIVVDEWNRNKEGQNSNMEYEIRKAGGIARSLSKFLSKDAGEMLNFLLDPDRFDLERVSEVINQRIEIVESLFDHPHTIRVSPSAEVKIQAADAALHKKAPFHNKNSMGDALILFSSLEHIQQENYERSYFISYNGEDFGKDKNHDHLHPDLEPLLHEANVEYSRDLAQVLNEIPDSNINEETLAKIEREQAWDSYISSRTMIQNLGLALQTSDLFKTNIDITSIPAQAIQEAFGNLNKKNREDMQQAALNMQAALNALNHSLAQSYLQSGIRPLVLNQGLSQQSVHDEEE